MNMDNDPLAAYEYPPQYEMYSMPPMPTHPLVSYNYDVKLEPMYQPPSIANLPIEPHPIPNTDTTELQPKDGAKYDKPKIKKPRNKIEKKVKQKKKSNYLSEKIQDKEFPFYSCAVCSLNYKTLAELDRHVTEHKGRITSYDLRIKNQIKKRMLKKKLKKELLKVKKEVTDVEIKPEDGYIGSEKAVEFSFNDYTNLNEKMNESGPNENELPKSNLNEQPNVSKPDNDSKSSMKVLKMETKLQALHRDINLEKIYKCYACSKQFTLSYYLKLHVRSHTDEKPYTCSVCGQSFITASKLGRHNKRIHLAIRFQCRICFKYFSRFDNLTAHFDKLHPEDKLEGEPYDYNAILPYLQELEEQLRQEAEKETKPKTEDLEVPWLESSNKPEQHFMAEMLDQKFEEKVEMLTIDVTVKKEEEVKDELDERDDKQDEMYPGDDTVQDDDPVKDESFSDEDYFPSNTWAATPKVELREGSPTPRGPGRLRCTVCSKPISSASYMKVHMRTHTGEKPFKCYVCGRGFITSSKMHRHVLTHDETWRDDKDQVKEEIKIEHDGEVKDEANKEDEPNKVDEPNKEDEDVDKKDDKSLQNAKKRVKKQKVKEKKERKRNQKRPHACEFCHQRFLHLETLQVHKKSHQGQVIKCQYCLCECESSEHLKEHEATHNGPRPYLCTICGKCYKKRETMIYHKKHHKATKEFVCDICSKSFNAQCKLQRHIVSHRVNKYILRYECPVCAHMFNTKYHVQMHLATHQKEGLIMEENRNEILAMVLQNARKIPKNIPEGATSIELTPTDERSRVCNICGEVFQHFYYLEEHLKSHGTKLAIEDEMKSEEKRHICPVCNKGFKLHYYLKLHSFTHTKEKPYICQQCGKGFITKGKLKRHLETHTGLKKYQCHICYKFFTRPSYLRIHVRTIHGTQDYNFRLDKAYGISPMANLSMMGHSAL